MDISATDITGGPNRLGAPVMEPGSSLPSRLVRLLRRMAGRTDPVDAEAYEEAVRMAFWTGPPKDRPEDAAPDDLADAATSRMPATRPARSVAWKTAVDERASTAPGAAISAATAQLAADDAPADERAADDRLPERTTKQGVQARDALLRTPAGVTPVADDFFAGLIRRVEGDR